ncbi:MAG: bifunctional DNA-formamidopyrimidine glycosylase/DNA-(apurinic or apyrimidinic site) lyase [Gemmatimonadetes bacterium]|nr:bifunctional DNA-formamidopyrimidine glycosylase/DNA-(apurinic or apyrimidinic site) lyase [Gemmatimonadota bacterium]MDA1104192.1 bifunctional DNA-formamidopyrimidine glycosylase/DNA-(apurinic or apyrimidinic site) lyase [Gemmatimonadota bacterium]
MPELPEAETIVRGLRSRIVGETIVRAEVLKADILREPKHAFTRKLPGRTIVAVERRAKNVLIRLDGDRLIAVNLGMTGGLLPFPRPPRGAARPTHPAVRFRFVSGGVLVFDDTRRFGTVECLTTEAWQSRSDRMGPEPLEDGYTADHLHAALARSRSPIRSWLLDQRRVAGVGNIYAAEALFLAGVHPTTPARDIGGVEATALHGAIRSVLREAIHAGGTTIRDYRNAEGDEGQYSQQLNVYGREGETCTRCQSLIEKVVFGNRSAFYCPRCQPAP